jgi:hypothetical protein
MSFTAPFSTMAAQLLVVPRSMPMILPMFAIPPSREAR